MLRHNRHGAKDIFDATGIPDIATKWQQRNLSEEEFNILKKAEQEYSAAQSTGREDLPRNRITLSFENKEPLLGEYKDYADYLDQIKKYGKPTSVDDSGEALAYFYDDGRNPISAGYDYAASDYGVRINNASDYNPRIFDGHLHYSMPTAVKLSDPNVEVFRKGPFGITWKMNKDALLRQGGGHTKADISSRIYRYLKSFKGSSF